MAMEATLAGKTALVTGGGRGIGKAIARRFAEAGANVVIASRKAEVLEAAAGEMAGLAGAVHPFPCHAGRPDQLESLVAACQTRFGPVDILVNNSATNIGQGPALEVTDEALLKTTEINVLAPHRLIRLIVPKMIGRGGGVVINIASIAGLRPMDGSLVYSFTKAGLIMMTRVWAVEFGPHNVRVNAICPGLIQTDFSAYFWQDEAYMANLRATQPLPRIGQPREVAGLALYLASDDASYVTGQAFVVDGGATIR
jgi:NAD(P)-dependent dehydrogenase (short-subunit alcohol dehydrogenase family)